MATKSPFSRGLERFPAKWNRFADKETFQIQCLVHVLVAKVQATFAGHALNARRPKQAGFAGQGLLTSRRHNVYLDGLFFGAPVTPARDLACSDGFAGEQPRRNGMRSGNDDASYGRI
jgi:hypothetical protein